MNHNKIAFNLNDMWRELGWWNNLQLFLWYFALFTHLEQNVVLQNVSGMLNIHKNRENNSS